MKEQKLYNKVAALNDGDHNGFSIHLTSDQMDFMNDATFRVYHSNRYCFEIEKQQHCEPDEVDEFDDIHLLQPDGATYHYRDLNIEFEDFNECNINTALKLIV